MTRIDAGSAGARLCGSILIAAAVFSGLAGPTAAGEDCTVSPEAAALDAEESQFLVLLNDYRRDSDRPLLAQSSTLRLAAAWMSEDRAARGAAADGHIDTRGRDLGTRLPECGYDGAGAYAENLCTDERERDTAITAFDLWRDSPSHNAAMLDPRFHYAGIARVCTEILCFWTLDLGADPSGVTDEVPAPSDQGSDLD